MAFALPLFAHLFDRAQDLRSGWVWPRAQSSCSARSAVTPVAVPVGAPQRTWSGPTRLAPAQRPLRVVRVVEGRSGCPGTGRMVISGRMADVCAELDRLAELETRH
jgi:hypothetical protein